MNSKSTTQRIKENQDKFRHIYRAISEINKETYKEYEQMGIQVMKFENKLYYVKEQNYNGTFPHVNGEYEVFYKMGVKTPDKNGKLI